jgi:DNA invertase Pin-like site-specific DNA recombinase
MGSMTINKYIGYIRVSSVGQAADGYGLDIQEQAVRARVGEHHRKLEVYRDEGVSGRLLDRKGLSEALRAVDKGDVVIVPRLDRLARDLISQELLLAEVRRRGGRLWSCADGEQAYLDDDPDDPSRRMIRQVLGAVSEYERAMVTLRLRGGRRAKRAKGGFGGGECPFGFHVADVGGLEPDRREQEILRFIARCRGEGYSYERIAHRLNNKAGMHPRKGKRWTRGTVWSISKPRLVAEQTEKLEGMDVEPQTGGMVRPARP